MIRAAHLLPHDGVGGVEVAATSMAREMDPAAFRLFFVAGASDLPTERAATTGYASSLNPLAWIRSARQISDFRPDVLIFSLWKSVPAALLAKLMRPEMRLAYTLNLSTSPHVLDRFATWIALTLADEAWSDSPTTERARKPDWIPGRILNFVRAAPGPTVVGDLKPRFVCWCRLHAQKGIDRGVTLIAKLRELGVDAIYDIYGPDNGEGANLQKLIDDLGLADAIRLRGAVPPDQIAGVASDYSFFLMPSRDEGMAMATVEAMQLGLVPVVTAVGEMANYVRPGENGVIIDPEKLDEAALTLRRIVNTPDSYQRLQRAAIGHWAGSQSYSESMKQAIADIVDARSGRPETSR